MGKLPSGNKLWKKFVFWGFSVMKQYKAFLSYSHLDEKIAKKLHRALENYRPPKAISQGTVRTLGPVFRDQDEMSAGASLSDKIKTALQQSEYLIVLASPSARQSRWVNDEIRFFRELKGEKKILSALIHQNPQDSFPPAILETGLEPLAANLTQGQFRLGVTQLAASMMNVGLDDLIQRDLKKLRRRVTAITVGAATALIVMSSLTWAALSAQQLAEQRRQDAEGQIEFMITDLKSELESVGRLAPLNSIGQRALKYYDNYPLSSHNADALVRRAKVFHMLGDIQDQQGNFETSVDYFKRAFDATQALLEQSPEDPEKIFAHAQSAYWVGSAYYNQENYENAEIYFQTYYDSANDLERQEGGTSRVTQEKVYALSNLGNVALEKGEWARARQHLVAVANGKSILVLQNPTNINQKLSIADTFTTLANLEEQEGHLNEAIINLEKTIDTLNSIENSIENFQIQFQKLITHRSLANIYLLYGNLDKAKENARLAFDIAVALETIEPNNIELKSEILLLEIFRFHLAFVEENTEKTRLQYSKIRKGIAEMPRSEINDYAIENLLRITASFPLYIAILEKNKDEQVQQANILLAKTEAQLSNTLDSSILNKYLSPYLLSLFVLDEIENSKHMETICNSSDFRLGFQQISALSTLFSKENCPAVKFIRNQPTTSQRLAIERLQSQ